MRAYKSVALHRTVLVNLTTGRAFRGVLFEVRGELLVLRNAELINEDGVVPVEGSVVLERRLVEFIQVVGA